MIKYPIGVVIGRFQVPYLHEGHYALLNEASRHSKRTLVLIGVSQKGPDRENPLTFEARKAMFPNVARVLAINDHPSDKAWSHNVDALIREGAPRGGVRLYGGRDSFISRYYGRFPTLRLNLPTLRNVSGSLLRKRCGESVLNSPLFRRGAIYATQNQFPRMYMCVDMACVRGNSVLMGTKFLGAPYQFPGGFLDPTKDKSLEEAALREFMEETDIDIEQRPLTYLGSFRVDDWRYAKGVDKLMTCLFYAPYTYGSVARASDDLMDLTWLPLSPGSSKLITPNHQKLFNAVCKHHWRLNRVL